MKRDSCTQRCNCVCVLQLVHSWFLLLFFKFIGKLLEHNLPCYCGPMYYHFTVCFVLYAQSLERINDDDERSLEVTGTDTNRSGYLWPHISVP